jgi:hypothetical protein
MELAEAARLQELERQIELCVKIAGLGFGPDVMRLALQRKGVAPGAARLIALSVASSHAALRAIEAGAARVGPAAGEAKERDREQIRRSRAAGYFLGRMLAFFWFGLIAIGGGLALGWMVGFEYGAADGYDWMQRSIEQLFRR